MRSISVIGANSLERNGQASTWRDLDAEAPTSRDCTGQIQYVERISKEGRRGTKDQILKSQKRAGVHNLARALFKAAEHG